MAKKDNTKEFLNNLENVLSVTQILCFFYAFFCVIYWFLDLTGVAFVEKISFLFEPVFDWVKTFYVQVTIPIAKSDLSPIIASIIFILIAIITNILKEKTIKQKELHAIAMEKKRKADDILVQKQIRREYMNEMRKYDKFIILVDFHIKQIKSYLFDNNVDENEIKSLKATLTSELFSKIQDDYVIQKSKYEKDSFYVIGKIQHAHECVEVITSSIKELSKKYSHMNITLSHDLSFDTFYDFKDIPEKLDLLKKIIQLNYDNCVITTSLFKTCFELIPSETSKLKFDVIGDFHFVVNDRSVQCELYKVRK